jgi:hypothetical protein
MACFNILKTLLAFATLIKSILLYSDISIIYKALGYIEGSVFKSNPEPNIKIKG